MAHVKTGTCGAGGEVKTSAAAASDIRSLAKRIVHAYD
jgi:hypothetical protein